MESVKNWPDDKLSSLFPIPDTSSLTTTKSAHADIELYENLYGKILKAHKPRNGLSNSELCDLDNFRYNVLPKTINNRREQRRSGAFKGTTPHREGPHKLHDEGWIELDELKKLMQWKLARGSPRPRLQDLIASNDAGQVQIVTSDVFTMVSTTGKADIQSLRGAFTHLTTLSGVGIATASLILSVAFPDRFPFFSDELLAWIRGWSSRKGGKIKYDRKEYEEIVDASEGIIDRFNKELPGPIGAFRIEKLSWVFIKVQDPAVYKEVFGKEMPPRETKKLPSKSNDSSKKDTQLPSEGSKQSGFDENETKGKVSKKRKASKKKVEQTAAAKRPRRNGA